jgi:hypothetical protein
MLVSEVSARPTLDREPLIGTTLYGDVAPQTMRGAVIFNPDTAPYYKLYMTTSEAAAASLAMKPFEAPAHNRTEIEAAICALAHEPAGGRCNGAFRS